MSLNPLIIKNFPSDKQNCNSINRISLDKPPYDENWLQDLIHNNPDIVPAGDIEPLFEDIIPVIREMSLASGYLDNLYITPDGYPVLVEVKLWKNQEARRKVVAQILEYAKDFSAINYETLNSEIKKLRKGETWGDNPLYEIVSRNMPEALDEAVFVDRVSRNLREGRFLLLILGDGVREGMESLANYLMHHSLRYAFGIVQIRLFTLPDGSLLALPDIMAKTQIVERHVTVITSADSSLRITEGSPRAQSIASESLAKTSLSLDAFFDVMSKVAPENVMWLKNFLSAISDLPIDIQVGKNGDSLMLKAMAGHNPTLMYITPKNVAFWGIGSGKSTKTPEGQGIVRNYLEQIAALVSGGVKIFETGAMDVKLRGEAVPLSSLYNRDKELKEMMRVVIQSINELDA